MKINVYCFCALGIILGMASSKTLNCMASQSIVSVQEEDIIIQGEKIPEETEQKVLKEIAPEVGVGAAQIDRPTNSYGVELGKLLTAKDQDVSLERRNDSWWDDDQFEHIAIQNEIGPVQSVKSKGKFKFSGFETTIKGGYLRDFHNYQYKTPSNKGFLDYDSYITKSLQKKKNQYFLSANFKKDSKSFLFERDGLNENALLQTQVRGRNKKFRNEINLNFKKNTYNGTFHFNNSYSKFDSYFKDLSSKIYRGRNISVKGDKKFDFLKISLLLSEIRGEEHFLDNDYDLKFKREMGKISLFYEWYTNITDFKIISNWTLAKDSTYVNDKSKSLEALDFLGVLSTSKQFSYGSEINFQYFNLLPTPEQILGDGIFLSGNPNLPNQKGYRISIGPWVDKELFKSHLKYFFERSTNMPLMEAISSNYAKTFPIGAAQIQGVDFLSMILWRGFTGRVHWTWQYPINRSKTYAESGRRIPGRPERVINLNIDYSYKSKYQIGLTYANESGKYRDKVGRHMIPSVAHVDSYIAYKNKNYNLKLAANNLYMSKSLKNSYPFSGTAGEDILRPRIMTKEYKFIWEYTL